MNNPAVWQRFVMSLFPNKYMFAYKIIFSSSVVAPTFNIYVPFPVYPSTTLPIVNGITNMAFLTKASLIFYSQYRSTFFTIFITHIFRLPVTTNTNLASMITGFTANPTRMPMFLSPLFRSLYAFPILLVTIFTKDAMGITWVPTNRTWMLSALVIEPLLLQSVTIFGHKQLYHECMQIVKECKETGYA